MVICSMTYCMLPVPCLLCDQQCRDTVLDPRPLFGLAENQAVVPCLVAEPLCRGLANQRPRFRVVVPCNGAIVVVLPQLEHGAYPPSVVAVTRCFGPATEYST